MKISSPFAAAFIVAALSVSSVACHAKANVTKIKNQPDLHGVWQSDGYGYAIEVGRKRIALFHVTSDSCVEETEGAEQLRHYFTDTPPEISADKQSANFKVTFEDYPIAMRKIERLPQVCETLTANTPQANYDTFVSYFTKHYAFFDLYDVDWTKSAAAARASVNDSTNDAELFDILSDLLRPLKDGHVSLVGVINDKGKVYQPNPGIVKETLSALANAEGLKDAERKKYGDAFLERYWLKSVGQGILQGAGKMKGGYFVQFGMASDTVGYIGFLTVAGFANGDLMDERADMTELNKIMDSALAKFEKSGARAVIIDVSTNQGGYDFISRAIASRFAEEKVFVYDKYAADSSISLPHREYVTPYAGARFGGPVYVLTSNATVSGGEILTLALRALPNGIHAGQTTRGAFSDVLSKRLPNGWEVSLSNEVYADAEGVVWEGRGIAPELPLPVFEKEDLVGSHVRAIRSLIAHIENDPTPATGN